MSLSALSVALPIACTPAAITAPWLTSVLRSIGHEVTVASVRSRPIGTGQSAHCERFYLDYHSWDGRAPKSPVAKLPHPDPTSRATGHVHGSYNREVSFYRQFAPTVQVRTPRCYYSAIDPDNSDFVLLLEDMAPAQQGDQMRGCSVAEAQCALREAHPSGHHRENLGPRCPATGAAGIQRYERYGNRSLKLRNVRGRRTHLEDQRLPDQPPCVRACGHANHQPFASFHIADEFNARFRFAA